jgi:hypothetical protein
MLKFTALSLAQKRFVVAVLNHDAQYKQTGRITLKECASIYNTLRDQRTGSSGEKIGYPNWLFNANKIERGVYQLPLPTEADMTYFEKQLAEKQTPKVAKAKAKVAKLQQTKTVKVKKAKPASEAKQEAMETSRLQKIIDDSVDMSDDVEDFNAILRANGIEV